MSLTILFQMKYKLMWGSCSPRLILNCCLANTQTNLASNSRSWICRQVIRVDQRSDDGEGERTGERTGDGEGNGYI